MKKAVFFAILLVAAIAFVRFRPSAAPEAESDSPVQGKEVVEKVALPARIPSLVVGHGEVVPPEDGAQALPGNREVAPPKMETLTDGQALEGLRLTIRNYGLRYRGNPVGNNAEITAALRGDNPNGAQFLEGLVVRVNGNGELVDGWGTPYFFHQLAAQEMEIRSAGPDRALWTADDLVTR